MIDVIVIPADINEPIRAAQAPEDEELDGFAKWCRETVGGYLKVHRPRSFTRSGLIFWLNEEAKLQNLPINRRATKLAMMGRFDVIAGDIVITGSKDPVTTSCPLKLESLQQVVDAMMIGEQYR